VSLSQLFQRIQAGDVAGVRALAQASPTLVNEYDSRGHTPLMAAAMRPEAPAAMLGALIEAGADVALVSQVNYEAGYTALTFAIQAGCPDKVAELLRHGADALYVRPANYNAVLDAAYGRYRGRNPRLAELVGLLIEHGAAVAMVSAHDEAALSSFSCDGRFDVVAVLLAAGAPEARLQWTPLHRAIALGTLEDVRREVAAGADLEARDRRPHGVSDGGVSR